MKLCNSAILHLGRNLCISLWRTSYLVQTKSKTCLTLYTLQRYAVCLILTHFLLILIDPLSTSPWGFCSCDSLFCCFQQFHMDTLKVFFALPKNSSCRRFEVECDWFIRNTSPLIKKSVCTLMQHDYYKCFVLSIFPKNVSNCFSLTFYAL